MLGRGCLLAALAALLAPPAAMGATASVTTRTEVVPGHKAPDTTQLRAGYAYAAAAGEANRAVLALSPDGRVLTITDAGAALVAGAGCEAVAPATVRCAAPAGATVSQGGTGELVAATLGDGDDVLDVGDEGPWSVRVDAGPGSDRVAIGAGSATGGDGDDVLRYSGGYAVLAGGPGADVLQGGDGGESALFDGGPGADVLQGGPGRETMAGGTGSDRIDGGGGYDTVGFVEATEPVTVDLGRPGPAGTVAEPDDVRNVEGAVGGQGDDVLRGTPASNGLSGGSGRDLLDGGAGGDFLNGGPGADRVIGGRGADEIVEDYEAAGAADRLEGGAGSDRLYNPSAGGTLLGGPGRDRLEFSSGAAWADGGAGDDSLEGSDLPSVRLRARCGRGRDAMLNLDEHTPIPADCERTALGSTDAPVSTRLRIGRSAVTVGLPGFCDPSQRCRVRVVLRAGARVLGRAALRLVDERTTMRVPVTPRARRVLHRARALRVTYVADSEQFPRTMTLRLPRR